jgi:hypothetical protein
MSNKFTALDIDVQVSSFLDTITEEEVSLSSVIVTTSSTKTVKIDSHQYNTDPVYREYVNGWAGDNNFTLRTNNESEVIFVKNNKDEEVIYQDLNEALDALYVFAEEPVKEVETVEAVETENVEVE